MSIAIKSLLPLALVLGVLLSYNFMSAAWTNAPANPPANNVDAPINTGATGQTKEGNLVVNTLGTTGNMQLTNTSPRFRFTDTDAGSRDFWLLANDNRFYLRADRDNADSDSDGVDAFSIFAGVDSANDYAEFAAQVRATEFCNRAGTVCFTASEVNTLKTNALASCTLQYRFRRNSTVEVWQSVSLNGTSNTGDWSTWSVDNVDDECNGLGCGLQMRVVCS